MINISVGEKLHVHGLEVIVIDADNANGRYKVQSTFDSRDIWTVKVSEFDEI